MSLVRYLPKFALSFLTKKNTSHNASCHYKKGFTLIELMLTLILLAVLTAIIVSIYSSVPESPTVIKAREHILSLENALKLYKLDNGFYPTTAQGLTALVVKPKTEPIPKHWIPYLSTLPVDPWGSPYHYDNPGKYNEVDIYSMSPPGKLTLWDKIYYWYYFNSYRVVTDQ